jgi:drug/metabolite transporter (DMT)-like permease
MLRWCLTNHPQFKAYAALVSVYFFWGTTYLAIRMALESFPPFVLMATRFLISGTIMMAAAVLFGARLPKGRELIFTALFGMLGLGFGNGTLVFAETMIPSGTAALFITTAPFWLVGLEALLPGGERLHLPTLAGIVVGFLGVLVLVGPSAAGFGAGSTLLNGFILLQVGCLGWNLGALLQRRQPTKAHPVVSGALQQLAVGLMFLPVAIAVPQHEIHWHARGVFALAYLVVFGSIVGYSSFVYAMEHLPVPIVSTYNYVNPIVAVTLGWFFYREPFGIRELVAMVGVFTGVALVKYYSGRAPRRAQAATEVS